MLGRWLLDLDHPLTGPQQDLDRSLTRPRPVLDRTLTRPRQDLDPSSTRPRSIEVQPRPVEIQPYRLNKCFGRERRFLHPSIGWVEQVDWLLTLQENWLLATKYFVTESLNFVFKNIPQRKFFRALFIALDPSLKVLWQKSYFVAQSFPWWNKILSLKVFSNEIFHRQK